MVKSKKKEEQAEKAPKEGVTVFDKMKEVFDQVQRQLSSVDKNIRVLHRIKSKIPEEDFAEAFLELINHVLVVFKREPSVERLVNFIAKFTVSQPDDTKPVKFEDLGEEEVKGKSLFHLIVIEELLQLSDCKEKSVRFRVCQLIEKILANLGDDVDMDEDVWQMINEKLVVRLKDKVPIVRVQAVKALFRFQDPSDQECPVINQFMQMVDSDSSAEVRKAVITNLGALDKLFAAEAIVERTRDVKPDVRRAAFRTLGEQIEVKALSISQRVNLLKTGLNDRDASVRNSCVQMVNAWRSCCESEWQLLNLLDVENNSEVAETVINTLIKHGNVANEFDPNDDQFDLEALDSESLLLWKCVVQHFYNKQNHEKLEELIPTNFLDVLNAYVSYQKTFYADGYDPNDIDVDDEKSNEVFQSQFITKNLILIAGFSDMGDECGRRALSDMIQGMLTCFSTPDDILEPLVKLFCKIHSNEEDRIRLLTEIVAEIRDPLSNREEEEGIDKDREHLAIEQRALIVTQHLLEMNVKQIQHSTLEGIIGTLILPCVQNANPHIRNVALRCLGLCCLCDKSMAKTHLLLFLQAAQVDQELIQATALQLLFDFLITYGVCSFNVSDAPRAKEHQGDDEDDEEEFFSANESFEEKESTPQGKVVSIVPLLIGYLNSESAELRTVAVEGFCKLMFLNQYNTPKIFSKLVILFYNPTTEDDLQLRQCLCGFFELYAFSSRENQETIESAAIPTIRTIANAPKTSPLKSVDLYDVCNFLIYLTSPSELKSYDSSTHSHSLTTVQESLSLKICNELLTNRNGPCSKAWFRALQLLDIHGTNQELVKSLRVLCEQIENGLEADESLYTVHKPSLRQLQRFKEHITSLDETPDDDVGKTETLQNLYKQAEEQNMKMEKQCPSEKADAKEPQRKSTRSTRSSARAKAAKLIEEEEDDDDGEENFLEEDDNEDEEELEEEEGGEEEAKENENGSNELKKINKEVDILLGSDSNDEYEDAEEEEEEEEEEEIPTSRRTRKEGRDSLASVSSGKLTESRRHSRGARSVLSEHNDLSDSDFEI